MKRVGVDIGGTFTDLVWFDDSSLEVGNVKALTTPDPLEGLFDALAAGDVDSGDVGLFLHATTLVTNLVLEREGAVVGLLTTEGFRDVLEIQTGLRPNPYDLHWRRTEPLVPRERRVEVAERIDAAGQVIVAPSADAIVEAVATLVAQGVDSVAVCFLHSYANPAHEELAAELIAARWPGLRLSCSSAIDPRIREYPRLSTTVVNAYALPAFGDYAAHLQRELADRTRVRFMQSSGGVATLGEAAKAPVNLIYSGPAGGVLGARHLGRQLGLPNLITLDMGGTSTDVCVITDGEAGEREELDVEWGIPVRAQTLDISAVGAGGGSIAQIDAGGALRVGPESAGGNPGPACYGLGGTRATVTDANLVLGLLREDGRLGRSGIRLDGEASRQALRPLGDHFGMSVEEVALGVFRTVGANMARAIREITVFRGIDPRDYALVAFGGCGPQHAVEVAREVGMRTVIVPAMPSVFSAVGLLTAALVKTVARTLMRPLAGLDMADLDREFTALEGAACASLRLDPAVDDLVVTRLAHLRYVGQSHELPIPIPELDAIAIRDSFEDAHERGYGTRLGDPLEIVDIKVTATGAVPELPSPRWAGGMRGARPIAMASMPQGVAPVYARADLAATATVAGRALIEEADSTTYLPSDAEAVIDDYGHIRITLD